MPRSCRWHCLGSRPGRRRLPPPMAGWGVGSGSLRWFSLSLGWSVVSLRKYCFPKRKENMLLKEICIYQMCHCREEASHCQKHGFAEYTRLSKCDQIAWRSWVSHLAPLGKRSPRCQSGCPCGGNSVRRAVLTVLAQIPAGWSLLTGAAWHKSI
jgi:hypothetical protein